MKKIFTILTILSIFGIGGSIAINKHIQESKKVEIISAKILKSSIAIKNSNIKKGTKYCAVKVKHPKTGIVIDIPSPTETCNLVQVGQKIKIDADKLLLKIK